MSQTTTLQELFKTMFNSWYKVCALLLCLGVLFAGLGYAVEKGAITPTQAQSLVGDLAAQLNQRIDNINATLQVSWNDTIHDPTFYSTQQLVSYVVSNVSGYYCLQNGTTGQLVAYNSNQTLIEQWAIGNTTSGTIYLKQLLHNSSLTLPANVMEIQDYQGTTSYVNGNFPFSNVTSVPSIGAYSYLIQANDPIAGNYSARFANGTVAFSSTNGTVVVNNALAQGGKIVLHCLVNMNGTATITQNYTVFVGNGWNTGLLNGYGCYTAMITATNLHNITIGNMLMDGNESSYPASPINPLWGQPYGCGIVLSTGCKNWIIQNLYMRNIRQVGIDAMSENAEGVSEITAHGLITGCLFEQIDCNGINLLEQDIKTIGNTFRNYDDISVDMCAGNCIVEANTFYLDSALLLNRGTITGNYWGIGSEVAFNNGGIISNNIIDYSACPNMVPGGGDWAEGIVLASNGGSNITLSGNTIIGDSYVQRGIYIYTNGNRVSGGSIQLIKAGSGAGIRLASGSTGNFINGVDVKFCSVSISDAGTGNLFSNEPCMDVTNLGSKSALGTFQNVIVQQDVTFGVLLNATGYTALATNTNGMPAMFMALGSISSGNDGLVLSSGIVRYTSWTWAVGGSNMGLIYCSTAGALTQTAPAATGNIDQWVGTAMSDGSAGTIMNFQPSTVLVTHA